MVDEDICVNSDAVAGFGPETVAGVGSSAVVAPLARNFVVGPDSVVVVVGSFPSFSVH